MKRQAYNPYLPAWEYIPDGEPRVFGDRLYIFGSHDRFGAEGYCENDYVAWSAPVEDLSDWRYEGVIFRKDQTPWNTRNQVYYAPDCVQGPDGRYYLYYFVVNSSIISVAVCDKPAGKYEYLGDVSLPDGHAYGTKSEEWFTFDPAVLVDDDGRAYLYFGGGVPEGQAANPGTARVVELGEDMISIAGEPVIIDAPYVFEDSGIHKYNNKYYYTYCSNWDVDQAGTDQYGFESGEIVCMESESPLGPFTIKETILENPGKYFGLGGNNHHCVFSFKDHWYITYHTRVLEGNMGIEKGYRCTHIDSFTMQKDGSIGLIDQTLQGREQLSYVDAYQRHSATEVAVMSGMSTVAGDAVTDFYGSGTMALGKIQTGSFVKVQGVDFGEGAPSKWIAEIKNANGEVGVIQLRADGLNGDILGYLTIDANTGTNYAEFETNLNTGITGVHDVYMIFYGEEYEVLSWQFEK